MLLKSYNQYLEEDKTANKINFGFNRKQEDSVNTETDKQFKKILRLFNVQKNFRKIIFKYLTAVKFIKFQRKSIITLTYGSIGVWGCFSFIGDQYDISASLMTMKTTTKSHKNQKFNWEVPEENVEDIWNHKLFSEKFICDPLNVFMNTVGAVNFRIMW